MTEEQKWQREIEIENQYFLYQSAKDQRAGDQSPSGPCSRLCWWYFEVQQSKKH